MPREQVEWYVNDDNNKPNTRQICSYHSMINNEKANYPYLSSYEYEQTWTLAQTMSNQHKRYQSSIENIHLTTPPILRILKIENDKTNVNLLPPLPPTPTVSKPFHSLSTRSNNNYSKSFYHQQPLLGTSSIGRKAQLNINSMRIMRINREFVVRI